MNIPPANGIFFCFLRGGNVEFGGMSHGKLPKSIRKYLRNEKARLRRARFSDSSEAVKEAEAKIRELVAEATKRYTKNINKKIENRK